MKYPTYITRCLCTFINNVDRAEENFHVWLTSPPPVPDAVDTVVCAPDDGWYHPKHVEQFPDKINCVTLHLVGCIC